MAADEQVAATMAERQLPPGSWGDNRFSTGRSFALAPACYSEKRLSGQEGGGRGGTSCVIAVYGLLPVWKPFFVYGLLPGAVNEQGAEIGVAALADPQQPLLAPAAVLARHQAGPCGRLAGAFELAAIAQGGDQCRRGDRPDPAQLLQPGRRRIAAGEPRDGSIQARHALVQMHQILAQAAEQRAKRRTERSVGRLDEQRQRTAHLRHPLGQHNSVLRSEEHTSELQSPW